MKADNNSKRTILADQHIAELSAFLDDPNIELITYDPHVWSPADYQNHVDALLIRTVTPVNENLIKAIGSRLRFIGTATSGTDHIDFKAAEEHNVQIADAKGCNAQAVAEYVMTSLLDWSDQNDEPLQSLSLGIAGVGHVGRQVARLCKEIEINTKLYDPPRDGDPHDEFIGCTESELLACDIITLHTPLTTAEQSDYPTHQWIDADRLKTSYAKLWINAARGGIIDDVSLASLLKDNSEISAIIDCWQHEPDINEQLLIHADNATPHIAGYSIESKRNATRMISEEVRDALDLPSLKVLSESESNSRRSLRKDVKTFSGSELLRQHGLLRYEHVLRKASSENRALRFRKLRTEIPLRHEFGW